LQELEDLAKYEQEVIDEVNTNLNKADDAIKRFKYVTFVSTSKGRGRKRVRGREVEMVGIKRNGVYCLASLFPFDVYASEVYPELSDWDATKKLEERIRGLK